MVFFSSEIRKVIKQFSNLFGLDAEGEELADEEEEPAEGGVRETEQSNQGTSQYTWLTLLKEVSDLTHLNFNECWEMGIIEFFNYLAFDRELLRRRKEMERRYLKK